MSGDVQPRKRREKKKKKEDGAEEVVFQHQHQTTTTTTTTSPNVTEDLNIHIQKEAATGGGLCAKFVFFILLTVLITLIGLIITEHRGLTDLDTIDTESRFAQLFDGWIDKPSFNHESPEEVSIEESEENLSEEEDHDDSEHDDSEEEASEEKETDENGTEEEEDEDEDEEDEDEEEYEESNTQDDDTVENETGEVSNEVDDDEQDEDDQDENDQEEEAEQDYPSEEEENYELSDEEQDTVSLPTKEDITREEEEESYEEKDDQDDSEETEESAELQESKKDSDITESEEAESLNDVDEDTIEKIDDEDTIEKTDEEDTIEKSEIEDISEKADDDSKETIAKVLHRRPKPEKKKKGDSVENVDQPEETENSNMVVKFGVGTALLVVAHVVLVQKWKTGTEKVAEAKPQPDDEEKQSVTPDLSRRNTIVSPPSLEEIQQDIENVEEEYSEDEEDYDSEDDSRSKPARAKMHYQELQSTYSHTLSPEWEPKEVREKLDRNSEEEDEELEEDEDYDDEISENEDEELLRRLETKYGKLRHSDEEPDDDEEELEEDRDEDFDSWKRVKVASADAPEDTDSESERNWSKQGSGAQAIYEYDNITNSDDWKIREELDRARQNLENDAAYALTLFNKILEKNPSSPRALYGKAYSLDVLAEQKRSNNLLQEAIATYQQVFKIQDVPDVLFQTIAERCIDRLRFRGLYGKAVIVHQLLIIKYPEEPKFKNNLAVTYLTMNKIKEARNLLQQTLTMWPNDGFALVHYGFILKANDNDLERAVEFLKKGITTREDGVIDGRFYFHLGDALTRLGRKKEAMSVYADGVTNKVFRSIYQRSLYNVEKLSGNPWWQKEDLPHTRFFQNLQNNWKTIRDEGLNVLNKRGFFKSEAENLRDVGDWKQFELYARGNKNTVNCKQCPVTCTIIETLPEATGCRRGQIKFSVMHPGTHVWPHCGPTNCRLRIHLGLKVPVNTYIRVGDEIRSWEEGKLLIFDDSFEHEVWHNGTGTRLVLIIDIWHPELTKEEKRILYSI